MVPSRPLWSWQDHYLAIMVRPGPQLASCGPARTTTGKLWSGQDHYLAIMVRPGPQLASMVPPGPQLAIMVRPGPQLAIMVRPGPQLASCGPARTTSTKEVKTQTSMVMHTSFGLF